MADPAIGALGWVLLYVSDLPAMRDFYRDRVGLRLRFESPGIAVGFATGACTFELMARPPHASDRRGWERNAYLPSFAVDDIDRSVAALQARGVELEGPIRSAVGASGPAPRLAQFRDPEGNLFELIGGPP